MCKWDESCITCRLYDVPREVKKNLKPAEISIVVNSSVNENENVSKGS